MRFGLIGGKLGHSHSKTIHEMLGLYEYELLETAPDRLRDVLFDSRYAGFNVTIPYKESVMPYCASLSDAAREVGCVNTLKRLPDGGLYGHNTDLEGFLALAARAGVDFKDKKVLILGSGGTGKMAKAAARTAGASDIVTVSRSGEVTYGELPKHRDARVIVNATPVGMYPDNTGRLIDLGGFPRLDGVLDVVYNPLRTRLVQQAADMGIPRAGGLYMLVKQAVAACGVFTGKNLSDRCGEIYEKLLGSVESIVLIGMPGSGKTTLGALLAGETGRHFVDTDTVVEQNTGMSIPDIFAKHGEGKFRELEREAIMEAGKLTGAVIATGGGAPLFEENRLNLRQNGRVFLIRRDVHRLSVKGRPLSGDLEALRRMETERMPYYGRCADAEICNDGEPCEAVAAILEGLA